VIETVSDVEVETARVRMLEAAQRLVAVLQEACLDHPYIAERLYPWERVYGLPLKELTEEMMQERRGERVPRKLEWLAAVRDYERLIGVDADGQVWVPDGTEVLD
jgi:uncharacterized protein YmfQ (DUF2313 family)